MVRDELQTAAEHLTAARDAIDDEAASDRLSDLSEQLETLSTRDRGPDHGRLARLQTALNEIEADAGDDAGDAIADARAAISSYRESVEGV